MTAIVESLKTKSRFLHQAVWLLVLAISLPQNVWAIAPEPGSENEAAREKIAEELEDASPVIPFDWAVAHGLIQDHDPSLATRLAQALVESHPVKRARELEIIKTKRIPEFARKFQIPAELTSKIFAAIETVNPRDPESMRRVRLKLEAQKAAVQPASAQSLGVAKPEGDRQIREFEKTAVRPGGSIDDRVEAAVRFIHAVKKRAPSLESLQRSRDFLLHIVMPNLAFARKKFGNDIPKLDEINRLIAKNYEPSGNWESDRRVNLGWLEDVQEIRIIADGTRLVVIIPAGFQLVDVGTGARIGELIPITSVVSDTLAIRDWGINADGTLLGVYADGIQLVNAETGARIGEPIQIPGLRDWAFGMNRAWLWIKTDEGLQLMNAETGEQIADLSYYEVMSWISSPDGRRLVVDTDEGLQLVNAETGERIGDPISNVRNWCFNADGRRLAVGTHADQGIQLVNAETGERIGDLIPFRDWENFALSADGRRLAVETFGDRGIQLVNAETGERIGDLIPFRGVQSLNFSADGTRLVVKTYDGVQLVNVETRARIGDLIPNVGDWSFSPDGTQLAAQTDVGLQLVDVATGTRIGDLIPNVFDWHFSADGSGMVVAGVENGETYVRIFRARLKEDAVGGASLGRAETLTPQNYFINTAIAAVEAVEKLPELRPTLDRQTALYRKAQEFLRAKSPAEKDEIVKALAWVRAANALFSGKKDESVFDVIDQRALVDVPHPADVKDADIQKLIAILKQVDDPLQLFILSPESPLTNLLSRQSAISDEARRELSAVLGKKNLAERTGGDFARLANQVLESRKAKAAVVAGSRQLLEQSVYDSDVLVLFDVKAFAEWNDLPTLILTALGRLAGEKNRDAYLAKLKDYGIERDGLLIRIDLERFFNKILTDYRASKLTGQAA